MLKLAIENTEGVNIFLAENGTLATFQRITKSSQKNKSKGNRK